LIRQGDATDSVVVVLEGQVKIRVDTPDGREIVHAVYGPADIVGEFEAIGDYTTRAADVVALGTVTSRVISRDVYLDYLLGHPAASLALVRILIRRLGAADRRRIAATAAAATNALARYLVELADSTRQSNAAPAQITVQLAQHDLASLIGVSRNSLVRALAMLRSRSLITTEGRTITIVDEAALRGYAEEHLSEHAEA
jgi:CRP/FNR family transcriptional regulator, cyclic AMP receptor protein